MLVCHKCYMLYVVINVAMSEALVSITFSPIPVRLSYDMHEIFYSKG